MTNHPILSLVFAFLNYLFRGTRCYFTSPQPYNLSYVVRLLANGQPDPAYAGHIDYKWYKNGEEYADGSFEDYINTWRRPFSEPGYYDLCVLSAQSCQIARSYDVNYPCPTPPTSSDARCIYDSFEPDISGVDGGDSMWCIAGVTNWMTGPYTFDESFSRSRQWEFDFYVATHCDADHDGNAVDNGDNFAVNFTPYKLTLDRTPR